MVADFWCQLGVERVCHIYCHISGHIKKETHKSEFHLGHIMSKMCKTCLWILPSRTKWKNQQINKHTSHILASPGNANANILVCWQTFILRKLHCRPQKWPIRTRHGRVATTPCNHDKDAFYSSDDASFRIVVVQNFVPNISDLYIALLSHNGINNADNSLGACLGGGDNRKPKQQCIVINTRNVYEMPLLKVLMNMPN